MDNRLIPPSQFDPRQGSLEDASTTTAIGSTNFSPIVRSGMQLRPPGDFTSSITKPHSGHHAHVIPPGHYQTPPNISRIPSYTLPTQLENQISEQKKIELQRLQAENETLKSIIQSKKENYHQAATTNEHVGRHAHHAVIEHQTQHIATLQKEIHTQSIALTKKESELFNCESTVASKEREVEKLAGSIKLMETQLDKRNEEEKLLQQEIHNLHLVIRNLKIDKDEITKMLQNEIQNNETNLKVKKDEFENSQEVKKHEWQKIISELEDEHTVKMQELKCCHLTEFDEMKKIQTENQQKFSDEVASLATSLEDMQKRLEQAIESLNEKDSQNATQQNMIKELESAVEESKIVHEKEQERINHLQTYIGEQQREDYQRSQWKTEKKQLEESIVALQTERENFIKNQELQNIRLLSITKILSTQEEAFHANTKDFPLDNVKGNVLVRKWREKVFELMIQCKSNEILSRQTEKKYKHVEKALRDQLEEEQRVSVILENQLSDCKAKLKMLENHYESLTKVHQQLVDKQKEKITVVSELEGTIVTMSESISKATQQICEEFQNKFTALVEKTILHEQRILFANNRLRTIRDLLVRKDNVWKAKFEQIKEQKQKVDVSENVCERLITPQIKRPDLVTEIERLTKERDALSMKLTNDSAEFNATTSNFTQQKSEMEKNILTLQHELQQKSEEYAILKSKYGLLEEKMEDYEKTALNATEKVKVAEDKMAKEMDQKLEAAQEVLVTENGDLEKKLEASQREHARTVVFLRQSERNTVREKKRTEQNMQEIVEECRSETGKLQAKIKTLKQDNNLLMATLRQQGLLSTFKAARAEAKVLSPKNTSLPVGSTRSKNVCGKISSSGKSEALIENFSCPEKETDLTDTDNPSMSVQQDEKQCASRDEKHNHVNGEAKENNNIEDMLNDLVVLTENILNDSN